MIMAKRIIIKIPKNKDLLKKIRKPPIRPAQPHRDKTKYQRNKKFKDE